MSTLNHVNDHTFEIEVLNSNTPVLVDFYADWCGPCRAISPMLEEIANEARDMFDVVKLDVDDNGATAEAYDVQSIPTLILFEDGEPIERWVGVVAKEVILSGTRKHLSTVGTVES